MGLNHDTSRSISHQNKTMFGLFNKKTEKEKLQVQYAKLLKEAHSLSTTNRKMSDAKVFEAEQVMQRIERLP